MKMNGPRRLKLGQGRNSWKVAKHAWLCSDLLQALKGNICQLWVLNRRDLNFCVRSTPLPGIIIGLIIMIMSALTCCVSTGGSRYISRLHFINS